MNTGKVESGVTKGTTAGRGAPTGWRAYASIGVVLAAAGIVGGAWYVKNQPTASKLTPPPKDASAESSSDTQRGVAAVRQALTSAVPAEQYEVSYTFTSSQQGKPFMDFSVQGALDLADATPAASDLPDLRGTANGEHMLQGRFKGRLGLVQLGKEGAQETNSLLQADFERPFYAKFAPNGQLVRMYFAPGVERLVQTSWRAFMSALQHVHPGDGSVHGSSWEVEEADSVGRFLARYSREHVGSVLQTTKTKVKYLALSASVNHRVDAFSQTAGFAVSQAPSAGNSGLDLTLLRSLDFAEKVGASTSGVVAIDITGETRISLKHARTESGFATDRLPATQREQLEAAEMVDLTDAGSTAAQERELDHAIAAGATFDSALLTLRRASKTDDDRKRRANAYRQFASLLRLHPEKVDELTKWIKDGDELSNTFISALRDAGTKEAQAALIDVYRASGLSDEARINTLRAVSLLNKPTTESTALLRELSTAGGLTGEQSLYGLGTHAARAAANGQDAKPIVKELLDGLDASKTTGDEAQYLAALGNAASREAVEEITAKTKSTSETVRREAVHALRAVPGADVDATLAYQLLQGDPDMVRAKAANAIRDREHTDVLRSALAQSLRAERSRPVKTTVIQVASLWVKDSSEVRASLEWLVANETDEMVRKAAMVVLGGR